MPVYKNEKNGTWYAMIRYKHQSENLSPEHGGSLKSGGICTSVRKLKKRPGKVLLANLRS